eukprot:COSAG01_NODE_1563_length_9897_cov_10.242703_11_plen_99_part_00
MPALSATLRGGMIERSAARPRPAAAGAPRPPRLSSQLLFCSLSIVCLSAGYSCSDAGRSEDAAAGREDGTAVQALHSCCVGPGLSLRGTVSVPLLKWW